MLIRQENVINGTFFQMEAAFPDRIYLWSLVGRIYFRLLRFETTSVCGFGSFNSIHHGLVQKLLIKAILVFHLNKSAIVCFVLIFL